MCEQAGAWQATIIREDRGETMAIQFLQNQFSVKIEEKTDTGTEMKDYTANVPFPVKISELLDEQLDEGSLTVFHVQRKTFAPFTKVEIETWNSSITEKKVEPLSYVSITEELKGSFLNKYKEWTVSVTAYLFHAGIERSSVLGIVVSGKLKGEQSIGSGTPITEKATGKGVTSVTFRSETDEVFTLDSVTLTVEGVGAKKKRAFFVATDKADEKPVGSGYFNHELYLIEETKWLERFLIPATGFVNALGRNYTD